MIATSFQTKKPRISSSQQDYAAIIVKFPRSYAKFPNTVRFRLQLRVRPHRGVGVLGFPQVGAKAVKATATLRLQIRKPSRDPRQSNQIHEIPFSLSLSLSEEKIGRSKDPGRSNRGRKRDPCETFRVIVLSDASRVGHDVFLIPGHRAT